MADPPTPPAKAPISAPVPVPLEIAAPTSGSAADPTDNGSLVFAQFDG